MAAENMCPLAEKPCAVVWLYAMTRQIVAFHLRWSQSPVSQRFVSSFRELITAWTSEHQPQDIYDLLIESKRDLKSYLGLKQTFCQMKFSKSFQWLSDGDINELISSLFRLVVRGSMIWRVHAPLADRFWILLCSARVRSLIPRVI